MMKKSFPKCGGCGGIITEDDCGCQTDDDGYTYCCGWSPYENKFKDNDEEEPHFKRTK